MKKTTIYYPRRQFIALGVAGVTGTILAACGGFNEDPRTPINYPLGTPNKTEWCFLEMRIRVLLALKFLYTG
ncbi:MAG: hypothetical protein AAF639_19195 [Chloroflexota bacterium]